MLQPCNFSFFQKLVFYVALISLFSDLLAVLAALLGDRIFAEGPILAIKLLVDAALLYGNRRRRPLLYWPYLITKVGMSKWVMILGKFWL